MQCHLICPMISFGFYHLLFEPEYRIQFPLSYLPVHLMTFPVLLTIFTIHFVSGPCKALHSIIAPKSLLAACTLKIISLTTMRRLNPACFPTWSAGLFCIHMQTEKLQLPGIKLLYLQDVPSDSITWICNPCMAQPIT